MQLNSIVFPAPACSYSKDSENLIWIPKTKTISCTFVRNPLKNELNTPNHKKSSSFDSQNKLFSPKFSLIRPTKPLITEPKPNNSVPLLSFQQKRDSLAINLPTAPILSKKNLQELIFFKNQQNSHADFSSEMTSLSNRAEEPNAKKLNFEAFHAYNCCEKTPKKPKNHEKEQKNMGWTKTVLGNLHLRSPSSGTPANEKQKKKKNEKIPCFLFVFPQGSNVILLHFHGNAEDIGDSAKYMRKVAFDLKVNALLVEYPGYGLYKGNPSSSEICKDAEQIFDYLVSDFSISPTNIILFGRSMGSGPAIHLAASRNAGGLILMSPYTSLKSVVKDYAGNFAKMLISERFNNLQRIPSVKCPVFLIHGLLDKLISYRHSVEIKAKVRENLYCELFLSLSMTHNEFDVENDIVRPVNNFFYRADIFVKNEHIRVPEECREPFAGKFRKKNGVLARLFVRIKEKR